MMRRPVAHILPDGDLFAWCAHGTPLGRTCQWCRPVTTDAPAPVGWLCTGCGRVWNPAVLACHHCPEPTAPTARTPGLHDLYPVHIAGLSCDHPCERCR